MGCIWGRPQPNWLDRDELPPPTLDNSGTYASEVFVHLRVYDEADRTDMEFMKSLQGKIPTVFPGGGREVVEAAVAALTFGVDAALIASEQAIIRERRLAEHDRAMADVACRYRNAYAACCLYVGQPMNADRLLSSEPDLAVFRDALIACSNEWFFVYKGNTSFVNRIGMLHAPGTFCFNCNLYAGHLRSVHADERAAILRMIAMHIIRSYETRTPNV